MKHRNFPSEYISWIKQCISTPVYSLRFNGHLERFIHGAKRVRQGDPLSPYVFIICMEVLSILLNIAAAEGQISNHPRCKKNEINSSMLGDDLVVFSSASSTAQWD